MSHKHRIVIDTNVFISALKSKKGASYKLLFETSRKKYEQCISPAINQFIASAVTEKISAFATKDYLEKRALRANIKKYEEALSQIPEVEPEEYDKL